MSMIITQLNPIHWRELKKIRLEALQKEPDAFASTYAESAQISDEDWQKRAQDPTFITFLAQDHGRTIGMVGLMRPDPEQDEVEIVGLYVNASFRGQRIGKALVNAALQKAKQLQTIKRVTLSVYDHRKSTIAFYKACGFVVVRKIGNDSDVPENRKNTLVMEYGVR